MNTIMMYLSKDQLINYWRKHSQKITQKKFEKRKVFTHNYIFVYSDCLNDIFAQLDEFCGMESDSIR